MKTIGKVLSILLILFLLVGCGSSKSELSKALDKEIAAFKKELDVQKNQLYKEAVEGLSKESQEAYKILLDIAIDFDYEVTGEKTDDDYSTIYFEIKTYDLYAFVDAFEDLVEPDYTESQELSALKSYVSSFKKNGKTSSYEAEMDFVKENGKLVADDDISDVLGRALIENLYYLN